MEASEHAREEGGGRGRREGVSVKYLVNTVIMYAHRTLNNRRAYISSIFSTEPHTHTSTPPLG